MHILYRMNNSIMYPCTTPLGHPLHPAGAPLRRADSCLQALSTLRYPPRLAHRVHVCTTYRNATSRSRNLFLRPPPFRWLYPLQTGPASRPGLDLSRPAAWPLLPASSRRFHWCNVVPETICAQAPNAQLNMERDLIFAKTGS